MQQNNDIPKRPVFLADNNLSFVQSFLHYLNGGSSGVRTFSNAGELIGALSNQPSLLIINGQFDNGAGFDIAVSFRERYSDLTIVILLDTDSEELQKKSIRVAPLCSLIMPVDFRDLKDIILKSGGL
ncbi:MAG: hypothetical protein JNL74_15320 [Fibrobacteres bacterium]|nr:hypothetical protein [Fibrobacterota bacterium]